jgi:hypothetical protein
MKKIFLILMFPLEILGSPGTFLEKWLEQFPPDKYFYGYSEDFDLNQATEQSITNLNSVIEPGKIFSITSSKWIINDGYSKHDITRESTTSAPDLALSGIHIEVQKAGSIYCVFTCLSKRSAFEQLNLTLNKHVQEAEKIWRIKWKQKMTITCQDVDMLDSSIQVINKLINITNPEIAYHLSYDQALIDSLIIFRSNLGRFSSFEKIGVKLFRDGSCPADLFEELYNLVADLPGIQISTLEYSKVVGCSFDKTSDLLTLAFEDSYGGQFSICLCKDYLPEYQWQIHTLLLYPSQLDQSLFNLLGLLKRPNNSKANLYSRGSIKGRYKDDFLGDLPYNIDRVFTLKDNGGLECLIVPAIQEMKTKDQRSLERTRDKSSHTISYEYGMALLTYTKINQKYSFTPRVLYVESLHDISNQLVQINRRFNEEGLTKEEIDVWKSSDSLYKYYLMLNALVSDQLQILQELATTYETINISHDFDLAIRHFAKMVVKFNLMDYFIFKEDLDSLINIFSGYYREILAKADFFFTTGDFSDALKYASKCFYLLPDKNLGMRISSLSQVNLQKAEAVKVVQETPKQQLISEDSLLKQRFINLTTSQDQGSGYVKRIVQGGNEKRYHLVFEYAMPSYLYRQPGIIISDDIEFTIEKLIKDVIEFASYAKYALNYNVTLEIAVIGKADSTGFRRRPKGLVSSDEDVYIIEKGISYPYDILKRSNDNMLLNGALAYSRAKTLESYFETIKDLFPVELNTKSCSVSEFIGPQYRSPTLTFSFHLEPQQNNEDPIVQDNSPQDQEFDEKENFFKNFWKKSHKNQNQ